MTKVDGTIVVLPFGDTSKVEYQSTKSDAITEDSVKKLLEGSKFKLKSFSKREAAN